MADDKKENDKPEGDIGDVPTSPIYIHKQYLKDMSFENPNAPLILTTKASSPPDMEMDIGLDVKRVDKEGYENYYEVILNLNASAKRDDKTMFIAEVSYGAAVSIEGMEEKHHHPALLIEVPQMLFPFVRQILANATLSGGFMPLQIRPVDFRAMYIKRFAKNADEKAESA